MHYEITERSEYLRAVVGDAARMDDFENLYRELQRRCAALGLHRALVVVRPESDIPGPDHIGKFGGAGFVNGFKLALVCATWTLYQACNEAERGADQATINVRAFVQETEAIRWLTGS
jgi:hypothetical protein